MKRKIYFGFIILLIFGMGVRYGAGGFLNETPIMGLGFSMGFGNMRGRIITTDLLFNCDMKYKMYDVKLQADWYALPFNFQSVQLFVGIGLECSYIYNQYRFDYIGKKILGGADLDTEVDFHRITPAVRVPLGLRIFFTNKMEMNVEFTPTVGYNINLRACTGHGTDVNRHKFCMGLGLGLGWRWWLSE